jgi:hypothetical protein
MLLFLPETHGRSIASLEAGVPAGGRGEPDYRRPAATTGR